MAKKNGVKRSAGRELLNQTEWIVPDFARSELKFYVANSVLEEFVLGHDHSAVLKELVQNEYDASGSRLEVAFGENTLSVTGNGIPIDPKGWRRLSVMLGTGYVGGLDRNIHQKTNGIGSKNFGLRSLFLYGDRINIRSGGRQTVLDLAGAFPEPLPDPASQSFPGVQIRVPYRMVQNGKLEPFSLRREEEAFASFVEDLSPTLIKLAQAGSSKSLRELTVSSERCDRRIAWKQSVKVLAEHNNIKAIKRAIRLSDSTLQRESVLEEMEFQKVFSIPGQYREQPIPGYFKVPGGRIRLALSLRTRRGKADVTQPGLFFYPPRYYSWIYGDSNQYKCAFPDGC